MILFSVNASELAESHPDRARSVRRISSCYQPFGRKVCSVAARCGRDGASMRSDDAEG